MREPCCLWLSATDRARLAAVVADRNSPQKHVWRARIILLTADRLGTAAIMRRAGMAKAGVWRWQERFLEAGRRRAAARQDPASPASRRWRRAVVERVVDADLRRAAGRGDALDRPRRWPRPIGIWPCARCSGSGRRTACSRTGCGPSSSSDDPAFAAKLRDMVGLYIDPPAHAVVLSVDEKSPCVDGPRLARGC